MKSALFAVLLLVSSSSFACSVQTYIINGQVVTCTICGAITTCN